MTIKDVLDIIEKMKGMSFLPKGYAESLLGPRKRGSTTERGIETLAPYLVGQIFSPRQAVPGCIYYRFPASSLGGRLGSIELRELPADLVPLVRARIGAHGNELFLDSYRDEIQMQSVDFITVIVGPEPDENGHPVEIVQTWHPGDPQVVGVKLR